MKNNTARLNFWAGYLKRYCETKALARSRAGEVEKFLLENIVLHHGAPAVMTTDRGAAFTPQLIQEVLKLSRTNHRRATAYHPLKQMDLRNG